MHPKGGSKKIWRGKHLVSWRLTIGHTQSIPSILPCYTASLCTTRNPNARWRGVFGGLPNGIASYMAPYHAQPLGVPSWCFAHSLGISQRGFRPPKPPVINAMSASPRRPKHSQQRENRKPYEFPVICILSPSLPLGIDPYSYLEALRLRQEQVGMKITLIVIPTHASYALKEGGMEKGTTPLSSQTSRLNLRIERFFLSQRMEPPLCVDNLLSITKGVPKVFLHSLQ